MTRILVAGLEPGAGATTIAMGLGHRLAYAGRTVRLERLAGDGRAAPDAAVFAAQELADTTGAPLSHEELPADGAGIVQVIEASADAGAVALAQQLGARLVAVGSPGSAAPADALLIENHVAAAVRSRAAVQVPEDRLLAAPTVGRLLDASGARVLSRSTAGDAAVCEHIVIAAISHDPADDHFKRFPRKAVLCRASRVDLALGAMMTGAELLLLTGGEEPSPYVLDRASSTRSTTLALAPGTTVQTARDIEGYFGRDPFSHEAKVERIGALMAQAIDDEALAALVR